MAIDLVNIETGYIGWSWIPTDMEAGIWQHLNSWNDVLYEISIGQPCFPAEGWNPPRVATATCTPKVWRCTRRAANMRKYHTNWWSALIFHMINTVILKHTKTHSLSLSLPLHRHLWEFSQGRLKLLSTFINIILKRSSCQNNPVPSSGWASRNDKSPSKQSHKTFTNPDQNHPKRS